MRSLEPWVLRPGACASLYKGCGHSEWQGGNDIVGCVFILDFCCGVVVGLELGEAAMEVALTVQLSLVIEFNSAGAGM